MARRKKGEAPPISEAEFQRQVIGAARALGWMVAHFRPARTTAGAWMTPVASDGAGFPDLVLVRIRDGADGNRRVVYAELKREAGITSRHQRVWLEALRGADAEVYEWRPSDWDQIVEVLRR